MARSGDAITRTARRSRGFATPVTRPSAPTAKIFRKGANMSNRRPTRTSAARTARSRLPTSAASTIGQKASHHQGSPMARIERPRARRRCPRWRRARAARRGRAGAGRVASSVGGGAAYAMPSCDTAHGSPPDEPGAAPRRRRAEHRTRDRAGTTTYLVSWNPVEIAKTTGSTRPIHGSHAVVGGRSSNPSGVGCTNPFAAGAGPGSQATRERQSRIPSPRTPQTSTTSLPPTGSPR